MKKERNQVPLTALLLLSKDNKVLLSKRWHTGYEDGKFTFPGGHVEKGEEIKQAAIREAKEEIGIDICPEDLQVIHVLNRKVEDNAYVDFILKPSKWSGEIINKEKNVCEELLWADIHSIPDTTLPFLKELLENDSFYIPFGWEEG